MIDHALTRSTAENVEWSGKTYNCCVLARATAINFEALRDGFLHKESGDTNLQWN